MATIPLPVRQTSDEMSAQNIIKQPKMAVKYGLLRKKASRLNFGKWPRRFVILLQNEVRVFADENSKTPKSSFSLQGYNCVKRAETKGQEWTFSIIPANSLDPNNTKTFGCISNAERLGWMKAVKRQMYVANSMDIPDTTLSDKLRAISLSIEDSDEYYPIEQAIDISTELIQEMHSDSEESSDSGSGGSHITIGHNSRSFTLPREPQTIETPRKLSSSASFDLVKVHKRDVANPKSKSNDAQPAPPPRYSEVMKDLPDYVNVPGLDDYEVPDDFVLHSLESLCTIHDENPDRDQLHKQLLAKKHPGSYLIRKSRRGNEKVLAFIAESGDVKEFKIIQTRSNNWTIDLIKEFRDINELLRNYLTENLPKANISLTKGFFEH